MASITTNKRNDHKTVQFVAGDGKRRSIRLGADPSMAEAREIKKHVEALNAAAISGEPWKRDLAIWIREIDRGLYDKLAAVGLVAVRSRQAKLGPYLADYVKCRADVEPATVTVYGHTRRNLVEYFGADKRIADIEVDDVKRWRAWLAEHEHLAENTVNRRCGIAKQFFNDAVEGKMLEYSPFDSLKGVQVRGKTDRDYELSRDDAAKVIDACPDTEWKLLVALSRFGGLRCPSEHRSLRWGDIDWARQRLTVHSPKTKRHKPTRSVPIFPELLPYLEAAWDQADDGAEFVVMKNRNHKNLATQLKRIIKRAGLTPWPKLWHNMRITRQNELQRQYPIHVACAWMGNSPRVALEHYLKVSESDFARACSAGGAVRCRIGQESCRNEYRPSKIPDNSAF